MGYNVQTAVDNRHHLIIAHEVTNVGSDRSQLYRMANQARDAIGIKDLTVVADRGYFKGEEILECHKAGITTYLPKPKPPRAECIGWSRICLTCAGAGSQSRSDPKRRCRKREQARSLGICSMHDVSDYTTKLYLIYRIFNKIRGAWACRITLLNARARQVGYRALSLIPVRVSSRVPAVRGDLWLSKRICPTFHTVWKRRRI